MPGFFEVRGNTLARLHVGERLGLAATADTLGQITLLSLSWIGVSPDLFRALL